MGKILILIIVIIILWILYKYFISSGFLGYYRNEYLRNKRKLVPHKRYYRRMHPELWTDKLIKEELSPADLERHDRDMVRQSPIFSSGAGYSVVDEANTSPVFTYHNGLFAPDYVPVAPGQRQVTDIDIEQLKSKRRIKW